jgi:gamma-glutamyltranspeptidase/glutathione hydrolase
MSVQITVLLPRLTAIVAITLGTTIGMISAQTVARNGMVVSESTLASDVGVKILKQGGNAIDAAVATAFALAVTYPQAGNIGGGGFLVYMDPKGKATTIDFREKAPLAATPDMFRKDKQLVKGMNHEGCLAIGVPGTVAGLYKAHQSYGVLEWATLVQPAIDLASEGFPITWNLFNTAAYYQEVADRYPFMAQYFSDDTGALVQFGEVWKQPELANTLMHIRENGHDGFYRGPVAEAIESFMRKNGGIITREDLAKYEAIERKPINGRYKDYDIYSMPPPSSGGVALVEMLNMMESAGSGSMQFNSSSYLHLLAEIMRRAYADRAEYLGDPDFNPDMPIKQLLSKDYAADRAQRIRMDTVSVSDPKTFGHPYGGDNTTHLSVMDSDGNAVSLTYTLEYSYGSRMGSTELGFIFNNEMGDFNPVAGATNTNGQIGSTPNLIAPGKRMLSSMTPTIIALNGSPYLIIGSPGGRTIINTVFQTVLNVLEHGMEVDDAIETPKIHHQWLPDAIYYEQHLLPQDVQDALVHKGHTLRERSYLGRLMGIRYDRENGVMIGASDSSSPDAGASGY